MLPIISIVGKSNSGKTTFLEKLIPELKNMGYKVGVVKHSHHQIEIDKEGKDSWRHQQAGADSVAIVSPARFAVVKQTEVEISLDDLQVFFSDMDIIITEGYKNAEKAKIEIYRKEIHDKSLSETNDTIIALVTDTEINTKLPVFSSKNYKEVAVFIEKTFINPE